MTWPMLALVACTASNKPTLSDTVVGHCSYAGPNSGLPECLEYLGAWTVDDASKDCAGVKGAWQPGTRCATQDVQGACLFAKDPNQKRQWIFSTDASKCSGNKTGCEVFGGGYWDPAPLCGGANDEISVLTNPYPYPTQVCKPPLPGEPAGSGPLGQVCTWLGMHGAVDPGRRYTDYAACDLAARQRAYAAVPPGPHANDADPRRADAGYLAEEAWVKQQVQAQSCACCHSKVSPAGPAVFNVDTTGSFANAFNDRGLAQGAGWVVSVPLGGFPAAVNNGFEKSDLEHPDFSIFMSTDQPRMKRFFEAELANRGLTPADFVGKPDGFGPLTQQLHYQPQACGPDEGIDADGTLRWRPGRARYVWVLPAESLSPTVPPNLDVPAGTLWHLALPPDGAPKSPGTVRYGQVPDGMTQKVPASGAPAALTSGQPYYLYVSADVLVPITRCLFTAK
jgi:hypothetical protein